MAKPNDADNLALAFQEAKHGLAEGGIPIGAVLVHNPTGKVLASGHNMRVQRNSNTLHAEMSCLENLGRVKPEEGGMGLLRECTMYTTLSPCIMCSATCVLYQIPRVVMGENANFVGGEDLLRSKGVEVVNLDDASIKKMMADWIATSDVWWEDIGLKPEERS